MKTRGKLWAVTASVVALLFGGATASAADAPSNLFGNDVPKVAQEADAASVTLGVRFSSATPGTVTGLRFYEAAGNTGTHTGALWSGVGVKLASLTFPASAPGWVDASFTHPVTITAGTTYVAGYVAPHGGYADDIGGFSGAFTSGLLTVPAHGGVYRYGGLRFPRSTWEASNYYVDVDFLAGATPTPTPVPVPVPTPTPTPVPTPTPTPVPTPTPTPNGGIIADGRSFPSPATTGVPAGTALTPYAGPCTITSAVTINAKTINCDLTIAADGVVITNSQLNGTVYADSTKSVGSFTISDSTVNVGAQAGTGIGDVRFTATRVHVSGGNRSINCYANCTVQDSYVDDQFTDHTGVYHESGIRMNSNSHLIHNTIGCNAPDVAPDAGCSAAITGYPDFDPVTGVTVENNLVLADSGGYCSYGGSTLGKPFSGHAANITYKDNVYQRGSSGICGVWGPITSFDTSAPGNVWSNNLYDNGSVVQPAN
jgi:cell division septation protein DedD